MYGLAAAAFCLAAQPITGSMTMGAVAHTAAVINLFNLIPVWQLDGSRGFASLTRNQRILVLVAAAALWLATSQPMLILIALVAVFRAFSKDAAPEPDNTGLMQFLSLLAGLTGVAMIAERFSK
jgi:Zn-dependent protease